MGAGLLGLYFRICMHFGLMRKCRMCVCTLELFPFIWAGNILFAIYEIYTHCVYIRCLSSNLHECHSGGCDPKSKMLTKLYKCVDEHIITNSHNAYFNGLI